MNPEMPRPAIVCDLCGRALDGVVELVDHYLLRHEHERKKAA